MQPQLKQEKEIEFLDTLLGDLYTNKDTFDSKKLSDYYKIDKEVVNYIIEKYDSDDNGTSVILKNIYLFLEKNRKNSSFYSELQNKNLEVFLLSSIIRRIENVIVFHLTRQKIVGKEDDLEYKLAFRKLADTFSNDIADYEEAKIYLAKELSTCIVDYNPLQTSENINSLSPKFKKPTYIRKNNKLIPTNLFYKQDFYKILDGILVSVSFKEDKIFLTEYYLPSKKISDIELDKLKCIGYFEDSDYANIKNFDKEKLTEKLKAELFNNYVQSYSNYIKAPENKYQENEYRDKIVIAIYNILKSEFKDATTHVLSIVSGYISAELGLLNTETKHTDSDFKHSYNQYLNKTVKNILAKLVNNNPAINHNIML